MRSNSRWKLLRSSDEIHATDFYDKDGNLIRVGDIIEYKRTKKTGRGSYRIPAGTTIKARVNEIVLRVKKDYSGVWLSKSLNVIAMNLNNTIGFSGSQYRLYNTHNVINTTPSERVIAEELGEVEDIIFQKTEHNDDAFNIGIEP
jgi:hypothetical protein